MKWRPSVKVLDVQIVSSLDEHTHDTDVAFGGSDVQWSSSSSWMRLENPARNSVAFQPSCSVGEHLSLFLATGSVAVNTWLKS